MSSKSARIAALIESCQGQGHDAHYLGFFALFNRGQFFESHDVLEELWLSVRRESDGAFFKGLIQLAGAFVHLKKNRLRPAAAVFKLAWTNLRAFPPMHHDLDVVQTVKVIELWLNRLEAADFRVNPLDQNDPPQLRLQG